MLKLVEYPEIQIKHLVQVYCIADEHARGVYALLPEKKFEFAEVERAKGAAGAGKEKKFIPMDGEMLMGTWPRQAVYNSVAVGGA